MNEMMKMTESVEGMDFETSEDRRFWWIVGYALTANVFLAPAVFLFTMYGLMFLPVLVSLGLTIVAFVKVRERCMDAWDSEEKPWWLISGTVAFGILFLYGMVWVGILTSHM